MIENGLTTLSDAAKELGVFPSTVTDLYRAWGITPKAMTNGRAKGLDKHDMRVLRRALNKPATSPARKPTTAAAH